MAYKLYINNKLFNGNGNNNSNNNNNTTFDKNTVYFVNTKNWSNVYVYAWKGSGGSGNQNSSWPGVKMTKTSRKVNGYDVYSYTSNNFLDTWEKLIFTNDSGSQTSNITITLNQYDGNGNATVYNNNYNKGTIEINGTTYQFDNSSS